MTVPSKWEIAQHWAAHPERSSFAPALYDVNEPCCFACGWYSEYWDKPTARTSWERATLERAHVVPSSLGGSDELANLILLCGPCHKASPDWSDPSEMVLWIAARKPRRSKEFEELDAWMAAATEVPEFMPLLQSMAEQEGAAERLLALLWESTQKASLHWGVGLSQGTRVAILRDAVKNAPTGTP